MPIEDDDTAPEGTDAGKHHGGVLHGKHSTEILVVCSVVTVVLGYLTFRGKSSSTATAAAGAPLAPGGALGDVAGFDAASVQGLSDQLQTLGQAQAGAFQGFSDAFTAQGQAQADASAGLQTAISNQGSALSTLTTTISALPQQIAAQIPAPIATPAPAPAPAAAPSGGGGQWYTIKSGDTLSGIAARYPSASITAGSIASLNGISNPNRINAGKTIRIY